MSLWHNRVDVSDISIWDWIWDHRSAPRMIEIQIGVADADVEEESLCPDRVTVVGLIEGIFNAVFPS